MNEANGLAHDRYEYLIQHREHVLRVGREVASLTVPHLLPPQGHTATSDLPKPYQSLGSRGIRNLSSKLLLTLFPPNTPFFKYSIDDLAVIEIEEEGGPEARGQIERG